MSAAHHRGPRAQSRWRPGDLTVVVDVRGPLGRRAGRRVAAEASIDIATSGGEPRPTLVVGEDGAQFVACPFEPVPGSPRGTYRQFQTFRRRLVEIGATEDDFAGVHAYGGDESVMMVSFVRPVEKRAEIEDAWAEAIATRMLLPAWSISNTKPGAAS